MLVNEFYSRFVFFNISLNIIIEFEFKKSFWIRFFIEIRYKLIRLY